MSKCMLINVVQEEESRVAIVDGGVLDFFEIETLSSETLRGNIYKGVVENVNTSLEAAFVNCGWERPGFLPLDEINFKVLPMIKSRKGGSRILEHVAPGMEFLVQVIRDRFNSKPPSLSTYYSLPGRYLVLTPFSDGSGVSRRIEDEEQRQKLRKMVEDLHPPEGFGAIVRTAGLDQESGELVRDMGYLLRLWETVERASSVARAPSLIYRERDLALRTIRDNLTDDVEEVFIDDKEVHENALRFIRAVAPHQESKIKLYTGDKPVFTRFNIEEQIESIYKRRIALKSGGEIVIEETEAMIAIDVNSSRSREGSAEETALRTNLEAAAEIARQLRLRDLGGLIVIDFIDMEAPKHSRQVEKVLRDAMKPDKAKYDATRISKLGILEISRQRLKAAKARATYVTCPACDGAGTVRTTEAAALAALRRVQTRVVRGDIGALKATLPTDVALYLLNQKRDELLALESRYGVKIALIPRPDYAKERCEIETSVREGPPPWVLPQAAVAKRPPSLEEREHARAASSSGPSAHDRPRVRAEARGTAGMRERAPFGSEDGAAMIPEVEAFETDAEEGESSGLRDGGFAAGEHATGAEAGAAASSPSVPDREPLGATEETPAGTSRRRRRKRGGRGHKRAGASETAEVGSTGSGPSLEARESIPSSAAGADFDSAQTPVEGRSALAATVSDMVSGPLSAVEGPDEDDRQRILPEDAEERFAVDASPFGAAPPALSGAEPETGAEGGAQDVASDGSSEGIGEWIGEGAGETTSETIGGAIIEPGLSTPGRKRRRRRRGGRGRRKHTPGGESAEDRESAVAAGTGEIGEPAGSRAPASAEASRAARPSTGDGATVGGAQPQAPAKRRRRRRPAARPDQRASAGPRAGQGSGARVPVLAPAAHAAHVEPASKTMPEPAASHAQEEDEIPGGWWSRLRGPKKRGGRED